MSLDINERRNKIMIRYIYKYGVQQASETPRITPPQLHFLRDLRFSSRRTWVQRMFCMRFFIDKK